jgi:putative FmdB family regulatory protein
MLYDYRCPGCGAVFEKDFPMGKAAKQAKCPECGKKAKRAFMSCNFVLKGGGWPSKGISFNKEMTERNEKAGRNMRKEHGKGPVRKVAHDYGNGDVREV